MKKIVSLEYDSIGKEQIFCDHYLLSNSDINMLNKINDLFVNSIGSGDKIYYDFSVHGELKKIINTNNIELLKKGIVLKQVRSINNATLTVFNNSDLEYAVYYAKKVLLTPDNNSTKLCIDKQLKDVYFKKTNIDDIDEYHIINDQKIHKDDLKTIFETFVYEFIPESLYDKLDTVQLQSNQVIATGKVFKKIIDDGDGLFNIRCLLDAINKYCKDNSTKLISFKDYINSTEILKQRMTISDYNNIIRLLSNDSSKTIGCEILYSYNHLGDVNTFLYASFIISEFSSLIIRYRNSKPPIKELENFYLSTFRGYVKSSPIADDLQNLLYGTKDLAVIAYYELASIVSSEIYRHININYLIRNTKIDISILDIYFQKFDRYIKETLSMINYINNDCIKVIYPYVGIDFLELKNLNLDPERYKALKEHYIIPYKMNTDYQDIIDDVCDN